MSYAIILYFFLIFPLLLGSIWIKKGQEMGFADLYLYGYMTMFAVFEIPGFFMVHRGSRLSSLGLLWGAAVVAISIGMLGFILLRRKALFPKYKSAAYSARTAQRRLRWMLGVLAFLAVFSITMVQSSPEDAAAEIVGISLNTNTMYLFAPYTQLAYPNKLLIEISPLEMLYAVGAYLSKMDGRVLVHLLLPCFLIPLYYTVGWRLSGYFFRENLWNRGMFTTFWGVFATIGMASVRDLSVGVFQNSWNGSTLFFSCAIPLLFAEAMDLWNHIFIEKKISIYLLARLVTILLASQLFYSRALIYDAIVLILCLLASLLQKKKQAIR